MEEGVVMSQGSSTVFHGRALRSFPIVCYAPTKTSFGGIWRGDNPLQFSLPVLLMQISLVFVFTRTLSFLSRPLNQPKVVTNILGGIILGPSVLGRRSQIVETWLFPQRSRTVVDTISMVIVTYFFFLIGMRMEPSLVKRASKKEISIGVFSIATAFGLGTAFVFLFKGHASPTLVQNGNLHIISWIFSTTSFPVLACLLYDYKFQNTEIGRISLTSATVSESFNWMVGLSSIAIHASKGNSMGAILSVMSCVGHLIGVVGPWMAWVVRSTPEEKKVSEGCILTVLVGVLTMAFLTELVGQRAPFGAFILGLAIPEGPPLGSAIVEKLDAIVSGSLMPLFYLSVGLKVDVFAVHNFGVHGVIGMIVLVTEIGKIAGVVIPSINLKMPIRETFAVAFVMASKGLLEIVAFKVWKDF